MVTMNTHETSCELMLWSKTDPPTCTIVFHGRHRDHIVTFRLEGLQVNELDSRGHIAEMNVMVKDGKVVDLSNEEEQ